MLAGHIAPITLINRAGVAIIRARRPGGLLSIRRAAGARPVATLGHIAVSGRCTADRARVARRMGACCTAAVADVFGADVAIIGTGCVVRLEAVRWTGCT